MAFTTSHRPASEHGPRSSPSLLSSHDLPQRIREGDEAAFAAMFRTHYDGLCRYVAGYLGSRDAAEDVVQGVFAQIWDDRAHWVVGELQPYLYAAVRRRATSLFRRAAVRRRAASAIFFWQPSGSAQPAARSRPATGRTPASGADARPFGGATRPGSPLGRRARPDHGRDGRVHRQRARSLLARLGRQCAGAGFRPLVRPSRRFMRP